MWLMTLDHLYQRVELMHLVMDNVTIPHNHKIVTCLLCGEIKWGMSILG